MKFNIEFTKEPPEEDGDYIYIDKESCFIGNIGYVANYGLWNANSHNTNNAFARSNFGARSVLEAQEIHKLAKFVNEEVNA